MPEEQKNKGGRPRVQDKRRPRGNGFSDAEWTEVKRKAEDAEVSVAEFVRRACLSYQAAEAGGPSRRRPRRSAAIELAPSGSVASAAACPPSD